jgi:ABC-type sugar transport system substrate-binding protein
MKKMLIALVCVTLLFTMSCAKEQEEAAGQKPYKIVFLDNNFTDQMSLMLAQGVEDRAKQLGSKVEVTLLESKSDINTQLAQVENAISQGVDGILIMPNDTNATGVAIDNCVKAGIPVVEIATWTENDKYNSFVSVSNYQSGQLQTQAIIDAIGGKGEIALMQGGLGHSAEVDRTNAFNDLVAKYPDIKVVAQQTANWQRDQAVRLTENWVQAFPNLKGIVCQAVDMGMGTAITLKEIGKTNIFVASCDGTQEEYQAIKEGWLLSTVRFDSIEMSSKALDVLVDILDGKQVEKQYLLDLKLITKGNVDTYLE